MAGLRAVAGGVPAREGRLFSLSLGVFDVFAYAVPGSLYPALGTYISGVIGWADVSRLVSLPTVLLAGGIFVASYLLGFVTYPVASGLDRVLPLRSRSADARRSFAARTPAAAGRPFLAAGMALLRRRLRCGRTTPFKEIARLRAVAIMIRTALFPCSRPR
jgi:hypothetical protein